MYRVDGRLVLSPSDLTRHQECHHLTALNLAVADGRLQPPAEGVSDQTGLVADLGIAHELRYLESLEEQGLDVVRLQGQRTEAATLEAMRAGVDVVHQATLFDGSWGGQADFLLRTETAVRPRRLVLRGRRRQAGTPHHRAGAAADGHLRRPARRPPGPHARPHPRRHRRRGPASVAAGRRRRLRPPSRRTPFS